MFQLKKDMENMREKQELMEAEVKDRFEKMADVDERLEARVEDLESDSEKADIYV